MLDRLIAFLRATLAASRTGTHPLAAEFARIDDYLALMAGAHGRRGCSTQLELPAELRELPVPPLLLQPLVENAIKHGLEPKVEGGRIEVSARARGRHAGAERARHRRRPGRRPRRRRQRASACSRCASGWPRCTARAPR